MKHKNGNVGFKWRFEVPDFEWLFFRIGGICILIITILFTVALVWGVFGGVNSNPCFFGESSARCHAQIFEECLEQTNLSADDCYRYSREYAD